MKRSQLKIGIVGAGNVGKVLSTCLCSLGYDVEIACRRNHRNVKIDGAYAFDIVGDFGTISHLVPAVDGISGFTTKKDIIIFANRTYDMLGSVKESLAHLTPKGMVVTIQNVFSLDRLRRIIPDEASVCMVCDFTCKTIDKVTYVKNFGGFTLGVYSKGAYERMMFLKRVLSDITDVKITNDIYGFTMGRNILNGAISALGGISGLRLKDILDDRNGRHLFVEIIREAYKICRRYRIKVLPYNYSLDYGAFVSPGIGGALYRRRVLRALKRNNGDIKSSALDDLENGNDTELRYMLESLIGYGKKTKTDIKYLTALNDMIAEIEDGKRSIVSTAFYDKKLLQAQ